MATLSLLVMPFYLLIPVLPPPLGQVTATLMFGTQGGGIVYAAPADCGCGVPASPRGPR